MQDSPAPDATSGHVLTNDGVRLYFECAGTGPPLILIHGWSGSSQFFSRNFLPLAASFRVIRYDLRGHGASDKPAHGFHVARLAADLLAVLEHLGLERAAVLGCSLGCAVIWSFVELFGTVRLSAALFVDQSPYQLYAPDGSWTLGSKGLYSAAAVAYLSAMLKSQPEACHAGTVGACMSREATDAERELFVKEGLKADGGFLGRLMEDHNNIDWRASLKLVTCPALVFAGERSKIFPVEGVAYAAKAMPDAALEVFESGHWLYYEEAERFNSVVTAFLERVISKT